MTPGVVADPGRLAAVRESGLLDSDVDEVFDRLTRLARTLLKVPATFVSIVDQSRDFYLSQDGMPEPLATTRNLTGATFCHLAIASPVPLVIPDTRADSRYRDMPTVESLGVAAYAGVPIRLPTGEALGSFCAIDVEPRQWSETEIEVLVELARSAEREIALRAGQREAVARMVEAEALSASLKVALRDLRDSHSHIERLQEFMPICVQCHKVRRAEAQWEPLAEHLVRHGLEVSHGYCPECYAEAIRELDDHDIAPSDAERLESST